MVIILIVSFVAMQFHSKTNKSTNNHQVHYNLFSHNDYVQSYPSFTALSFYYGWIEADIWYLPNISKTVLFIAHDIKDVDPDKTLKSMYLDPLKQRVDKYGSIWDDHETQTPLNLVIDIKSDEVQTYQALNKLISQKYADMVTSFMVDPTKGTISKYQSYLNIVISGNRDFDGVTNEKIRYISLDGRFKDIANPTNITQNHQYVPMISDHFPTVFPDYMKEFDALNESTWTLNEEDLENMRKYLLHCRERKQYLRFWSLPNVTKLWRQINLMDIHQNTYIFNTDQPEHFLNFV